MGKRIKERVFRMKEFDVCHNRSANKVGVDGVLIGAWARVPPGASRILDAGSGCGLISLMLAQRFPELAIDGVEIDPEAAAEARENASRSPWCDRIEIICVDFADMAASRCGQDEYPGGDGEVEDRSAGIYDAIVSNPPFFHAGISSPGSRREQARHADTLSPEALLDSAPALLRSGGLLSFICQAESEAYLLGAGSDRGLIPVRITRVRGNNAAEPKRIMMEWLKPVSPMPEDAESAVPQMDMLTIEHSPGEYTEEYRQLCRDFYINM